MKRLLSELIREGAQFRPQTDGVFVSKDGSCAIGAAAEAAGFVKPLSNGYYTTDLEWVTEMNDLTLEVYELNDHQGWTRERIADWLVDTGKDVEMRVNQLPMVPITVPERELVPVR